jgi:serine/threonine protein kinase HipA of HipAB toxin-antitoxin module
MRVAAIARDSNVFRVERQTTRCALANGDRHVKGSSVLMTFSSRDKQ